MFYEKNDQCAEAPRSLRPRALAWVGVIACALQFSLRAANAAPVHHDLTLRLAPDAASIEVVDLIDGIGPGVAAFRLASRFTVTATTATGVEIELHKQPQGWVLQVPRDAAGQVRLHYTATLPDIASTSSRASAFVGSEGSYLPAGWGWLPQFEDLTDSYRMTAIVPDPQRVLVSGRLQSEKIVDGEYRAVFGADERPEPALFAGPYVVDEKKVGSTFIRTYFESGFTDLSPVYLNASSTFLKRYSDSIGAYPFTRYSMVSAPIPVGLGFPGIAYISRQILASPYMQGRSLAHEVLHNWWGNGVYVDYGAGNWAEGLTTFLADYALAEEKGPEPARRMRFEWLRNSAALPASRDRPAVDFRSKNHDAAQIVGYDKVAYFFYMLRDVLEADTFAAGLRHLWRTQAFRVAGWSELRASFEAVSGRELSRFFAQWLERAGAPRLYIDGAGASESTPGSFDVTLSLRQDAPIYDLTVPVFIETVNGSEERTIVLDDRQGTATWRLGDEPKLLTVDPDHHLLLKLAPRELPPILRDVTLSDRVSLLIATAEPDFEARARALAERLMQGVVNEVDLRSAERFPGPLLVVGDEFSIAAVLEVLGIVAPAEVGLDGATSSAWVTRRQSGAEVLTVTARDEGSLAAVSEPLRYYGRRGYVAFEGRNALASGDWRSTDGPLIWRFD